MSLLGLALAAVVAVLMGKFIIRWIGWSTNARALMRWGVALIAPVVLLPLVPVAIGAIAGVCEAAPPLPAGGEIGLVALAVLGILVSVGFLGWRIDSARRNSRADRPRMVTRRRALPPVPGAQHNAPPPNRWLGP